MSVHQISVCGAFGITCHILVLLLLSATTSAQAANIERIVPPGESLQNAIHEAGPGDTLILESGRHDGPVTIERPLTLRGRPGAIIDGNREGPVIAIRADQVRIEGLSIRNSGLRLGKDDAGIHAGDSGCAFPPCPLPTEGNVFLPASTPSAR